MDEKAEVASVDGKAALSVSSRTKINCNVKVLNKKYVLFSFQALSKANQAQQKAKVATEKVEQARRELVSLEKEISKYLDFISFLKYCFRRRSPLSCPRWRNRSQGKLGNKNVTKTRLECFFIFLKRLLEELQRRVEDAEGRFRAQVKKIQLKQTGMELISYFSFFPQDLDLQLRDLEAAKQRQASSDICFCENSLALCFYLKLGKHNRLKNKNRFPPRSGFPVERTPPPLRPPPP